MHVDVAGATARLDAAIATVAAALDADLDRQTGIVVLLNGAIDRATDIADDYRRKRAQHLAAKAAEATGRSENVVRALLAEMDEDPELAARVRDRLQRPAP